MIIPLSTPWLLERLDSCFEDCRLLLIPSLPTPPFGHLTDEGVLGGLFCIFTWSMSRMLHLALSTDDKVHSTAFPVFGAFLVALLHGIDVVKNFFVRNVRTWIFNCFVLLPLRALWSLACMHANPRSSSTTQHRNLAGSTTKSYGVLDWKKDARPLKTLMASMLPHVLFIVPIHI